MTLSSGSRLGAYEILAPLGAGGMGEVYKARDTRLERSVAIKVLPIHLSDDPDLKQRLDREARAVAALNHPHICVLHDIGAQNGIDFLVMEYLEGDTLEARLSKGPLPLNQALTIAIQIASALDAAHRLGITHRDLKPGNVMLTKSGAGSATSPHAKLLDFGLAKTSAAVASSSLSGLPTTPPVANTAKGTILGTFQYMAPEQLEGQDADARSDIFAFGTVLYELLTGRKAFEGKSQASLISAIMTAEPPAVSTLQPLTPVALDQLVNRCLAKDPDERWQHIGDVKHQLTAIASTPAATAGSPSSSSRRRQLPWIVGAAAAVLSALAAVVATRALMTPTADPPSRPTMRLTIDVGRDVSFARDLPVATLSPDGTRVVFVSTGTDGVSRLSMRRLDQAEATILRGTEAAYFPFFSPDGLWVGFFAGGKLKKVQLDGSAPVVLCDASAGRGASWSEDGRIIAALDNRAGLTLVNADSGLVTPATELGPGELTHRVPQWLPGGKAVLFLVSSTPGSYNAADIAVASLGDKPARARIILPGAGMFPRYVPTGHLLYIANGTMYAVPFDPDRLEVHGAAVPVLEDVSAAVALGVAQMDISKNGDLLYRSGRTTGRTVIQWLSATGALEPLWNEPAFYQTPQLTPDGNRLMAVRIDGATTDVWIYDVRRGTKTRVTSGTGVNSVPTWSADGQQIAFQLGGQLYSVRADAAERPQPLLMTANAAYPASFTPDDRRLMFYELKSGGGSVIRTVPITVESGRLKAGAPEAFREVPSGSPSPTFSRDGRWVAYASTESGPYEVYVRAFPDTGQQWVVSTGGGNFPVWSRSTNELFYRTEDQLLMAVSYSVADGSFVAGKPRVWTNTRLFNTGLVQNFALAPDGKRFAVLISADRDTAQGPEMLVLNFFDELRRRVSAPRP